MAVSGAGDIGYEGEIYYDADGDIASATWVLIPDIQDVQETSSKNKATIPVRNVPVVGVLPTHTVLSHSVTITKANGATVYDALHAAYVANTRIGIASMTGPIATSGESGWQYEAFITDWNDDGSHEGVSATFTVEPAANATTAATYTTIA